MTSGGKALDNKALYPKQPLPPEALTARLRRLAETAERAAPENGLAVAPIFALAPILAACGGGSSGNMADPEPPPAPEPNEPPAFSGDRAIELAEGANLALKTEDLSAADPNAADGPEQLTWRVTAAPENGRIALASAPGTAITSFTQAQLAAGEIVYVHDGGETVSDTFMLRVEDDNDPAARSDPATVTVTVSPVDDAPHAVTLTGTVTALREDADTSAARKVADIAVADVDGGPRGLELTGADAALFELNDDGTELRLKAGAELDFAGNPTLDVTVRAAGNHEAAAALRIQISGLNRVNGDDDANTLNGTAGADILTGLAGSDTLDGMGGDDVIDGGAHDDKMTGGDGADTFVYRFDSAKGGLPDSWTGTGGEDSILDFNPAQGDKIRFVDANTGANRIDTLAEFKAAFDLDSNANLALRTLDREDNESVSIQFGAPSDPDQLRDISGQHKLDVFTAAAIPAGLFDMETGQFDDVDAFVEALGGADALQFG